MTAAKTKTVPISQASTAQIREYGALVMGLELSPKWNRSQLLSKMQSAGFDRDEIELIDHGSAVQERPEVTPEAATVTDTKGREYVRVLIATEDKPGGDEPVPVSVNGKCMWIPRGEEVPVPKEYFLVLQNAVQFIYPEFDGEDLGGLKQPRKVQSYPFTMSGAV